MFRQFLRTAWVGAGAISVSAATFSATPAYASHQHYRTCKAIHFPGGQIATPKTKAGTSCLTAEKVARYATTHDLGPYLMTGRGFRVAHRTWHPKMITYRKFEFFTGHDAHGQPSVYVFYKLP